MKRFLTVLLVIAVMFTFSFGTSFAADLTLDDYNKALTAEKNNQVNYLQNAKTQSLNGLTFTDGYATITAGVYAKAPIEAAADQVIADATKAIDAKINTALNGTIPATDDSKAVIAAVVVTIDGTDYTLAELATKAKMDEAISKEKATLDKVQAPITKAAVEAEIAKVKVEDYDSETVFVGPDSVTYESKAEYIQTRIDAAKKAVADADKEAADADKILGYTAAIEDGTTGLKATIATVETKADEAIAAGGTAKDVDQAVNKYIATAIETNDLATVFPVTNKGLFPYDATVAVTGTYADFYKAGAAATPTKNVTLFGVAIADAEKVTREEAVAVNDAAYAVITGVKATLKAFVEIDNDLTKVDASAPAADKLSTIYNCTAVEAKIEEVKAYGEQLKAETSYGIKVNDDAQVDKAVEAAIKDVKAALGSGALDSAKNYIAATGIDISNKDYNVAAFEKAQQDAIAKFIDNAKTVGVDKTPAEDMIFVKAQYADGSVLTGAEAQGVDKYTTIKAETIAAINAAQSYADIEKAVAQAKEDLAKLMLRADEQKVKDARDAYSTSLGAYADQKVALLGEDWKKYDDDANKANGVASFDNAVAAGIDLINEAVTVEAVKAAYDEAMKLVDSVKTNDELDAAAKAVNDAVAALPYTAALTADDEAAVKAAYDAYAAYVKEANSDAKVAGSTAMLEQKLQKITDIKAAALEEEAKALDAEMAKLNVTITGTPATNISGNDSDIAAYAALADKAQAVVDAKAALDKEVADITEVTAPTVGTLTKVAAVEAAVDNGNFEVAKVEDATIKMTIASKDGATAEEIQAAADAYAKLTEKQQYELQAAGITTNMVQDVLAKAEKPAFDDEAVKAALQDMAIVARSTKLSSGKIKVTVKADVQTIVDNGYTVKYKFFASTKSSKKGYASKIEKSTKSFTTSGVKGKTNYWKVTVKVFDAEGNLVAKTPLTQCRYACRTL